MARTGHVCTQSSFPLNMVEPWFVFICTDTDRPLSCRASLFPSTIANETCKGLSL